MIQLLGSSHFGFNGRLVRACNRTTVCHVHIKALFWFVLNEQSWGLKFTFDVVPQLAKGTWNRRLSLDETEGLHVGSLSCTVPRSRGGRVSLLLTSKSMKPSLHSTIAQKQFVGQMANMFAFPILRQAGYLEAESKLPQTSEQNYPCSRGTHLQDQTLSSHMGKQA